MNGLKLLGHPLHPAIVHFPVAAWTATVVTDVLFLALGDPLWWHISEWLLVIGVVTALGAMTAGFVDLVALPAGQAAQRRALRHMFVMSGAWTIYAIDLLVRFLAPIAWLGLALSVAGFAILLVGTHFGAQLVYDLGVGQTGRKLS
jgi:uncharacterized membrane protein